MSLADPGLALVLDPGRLAELVGREVRATYVRPKLGVSTTAALTNPDGTPWGWVRTLTGGAAAKAGKARRSAEEAGLGRVVGEADLPGRDTLVQWGPVVSDPRLVGIAAALDPAPGDVLRHNPLRRLVVRDGDRVVRVTSAAHRSRLAHVTDDLAAAGVPVLTCTAAPDGRPAGRRVSWWPWVEGTDAASLPDGAEDVLHEAGRGLGRLHCVDPARVRGLVVRGWAEALAAARSSVELLEEVASGAAGGARRVLDRLPADVPADGLVVCHGDLSPDQLLVSAGSGEVVLTDLDRAVAAPAVLDHASLVAVDLLDGRATLGPLAQGYAGTAGTRPSAPGPWVAAALLGRIAEPWRHQVPGWPGETVRRALLAARVLPVEDVWALREPLLEVAR
ncbi:phosphotransferase enzyme family protein [Ornithinimicrobium avium]|uniref:Aminoglycoside phosphotransferase domain-containing protein n=1 Tax=Ornithinimicrobium avium TaxID=2283195 RepID=A0A345NMT4_9MICO|nr:phosphotransferase [Ornithinimicrobium avium]AXH96342.1 hypothetical protein DV701_09625 [Ornithinimicrobium avium]